MSVNRPIRFIDLFAGIGGIILPFDELGYKCVFSSEWDKKVMKQSNNTFNSFTQRDTDYDAIVQERIMNRSMA